MGICYAAMPSTEFVYNHTPGKLKEFIEKLQTIAAPQKMMTEFPKSIGFSSSHGRGFPAVLKQAGLLDASGQPTEAYKKGLRGGSAGRPLVGKAIAQGYQTLFNVCHDADIRWAIRGRYQREHSAVRRCHQRRGCVRCLFRRHGEAP
ncbi:DUF5343 domain-containing protein [Actinacidiphila alni]|uniref:DUF5343 domain-containing protein n=1 Tax=Actinacidiphila alni TaxID=380248 RepID=UPI0033D68DF5